MKPETLELVKLALTVVDAVADGRSEDVVALAQQIATPLVDALQDEGVLL